MKRLAPLTLTATFLASATAAQAFDIPDFPRTPSEHASAFATCTGVYAATVEFAEFFGEIDLPTAQARRASFAALAEASLPLRVSTHRHLPDLDAIQERARRDHRRQLSITAFARSTLRIARARTAVQSHLDWCDSLLLGI